MRTYESHNPAPHRTRQRGSKGRDRHLRERASTRVLGSTSSYRLPSLTYLLVFRDRAARERMAAVREPPDWKVVARQATPTPRLSRKHLVHLETTGYSQSELRLSAFASGALPEVDRSSIRGASPLGQRGPRSNQMRRMADGSLWNSDSESSLDVGSLVRSSWSSVERSASSRRGHAP